MGKRGGQECYSERQSKKGKCAERSKKATDILNGANREQCAIRQNAQTNAEIQNERWPEQLTELEMETCEEIHLQLPQNMDIWPSENRNKHNTGKLHANHEMGNL